MSSQKYEQHIESESSRRDNQDLRSKESNRSETQYERKEQYNQQSDAQYRQRTEERSEEKTVHTGYTKTEVRPPILTSSPVIVASTGVAQDLVGGFSANIARVTETTHGLMLEKTPEVLQLERQDDERYQRERDLITQQHQKEIENLTENYRKKAEVEAQRVRQELEKQHQRDMQFRKELIDIAIDRQRREVDLEAKLAKKALEREAELAKETLDRTKLSTNVDINFNAAAAVGKANTEGVTVSESEKYTRDVRTK